MRRKKKHSHSWSSRTPLCTGGSDPAPYHNKGPPRSNVDGLLAAQLEHSHYTLNGVRGCLVLTQPYPFVHSRSDPASHHHKDPPSSNVDGLLAAELEHGLLPFCGCWVQADPLDLPPYVLALGSFGAATEKACQGTVLVTGRVLKCTLRRRCGALRYVRRALRVDTFGRTQVA